MDDDARDTRRRTVFPVDGGHPVRLFIGSGMPHGAVASHHARFGPAQVLEFYASTESDVILANVAGSKSAPRGVRCRAARGCVGGIRPDQRPAPRRGRRRIRP